MAAQQAVHFIGMPEGVLPAGRGGALPGPRAEEQRASTAPTARRCEDVAATRNEPVPLHLRNAVTGLMRQMGYGKGYKYAHDYDGHTRSSSTGRTAPKDTVLSRRRPGLGGPPQARARGASVWARTRGASVWARTRGASVWARTRGASVWARTRGASVWARTRGAPVWARTSRQPDSAAARNTQPARRRCVSCRHACTPEHPRWHSIVDGPQPDFLRRSSGTRPTRERRRRGCATTRRGSTSWKSTGPATTHSRWSSRRRRGLRTRRPASSST